MKAGGKMADGACNGRAGAPLAPVACRGLRARSRKLGVSGVILMCGLGALAQYAINWHTIDSGGGTSTGDVYSVSGTIGQPDAGRSMTNGQYSVTGGFWALPQAVQVPGAPLLLITVATPGNVTISWSPDAPGFVLQETWSLSPANWTNSSSGATNPVTVSASAPAKFYRLNKP